MHEPSKVDDVAMSALRTVWLRPEATSTRQPTTATLRSHPEDGKALYGLGAV